MLFFLSSLVLLLQNVIKTMFHHHKDVLLDEGDACMKVGEVHDTLVNINSIMASILHNFRIVDASTLVDQELGWWVLSWSTS